MIKITVYTKLNVAIVMWLDLSSVIAVIVNYPDEYNTHHLKRLLHMKSPRIINNHSNEVYVIDTDVFWYVSIEDAKRVIAAKTGLNIDEIEV